MFVLFISDYFDSIYSLGDCEVISGCSKTCLRRLYFFSLIEVLYGAKEEVSLFG